MNLLNWDYNINFSDVLKSLIEEENNMDFMKLQKQKVKI